MLLATCIHLRCCVLFHLLLYLYTCSFFLRSSFLFLFVPSFVVFTHCFCPVVPSSSFVLPPVYRLPPPSLLSSLSTSPLFSLLLLSFRFFFRTLSSLIPFSRCSFLPLCHSFRLFTLSPSPYCLLFLPFLLFSSLLSCRSYFRILFSLLLSRFSCPNRRYQSTSSGIPRHSSSISYTRSACFSIYYG